MSATSRELVYQTLNFEGPARVPRQMWTLPAAELRHPGVPARILERFPPDIGGVSGHWREMPKIQGDGYSVGTYIDEWGAVFDNIQAGVIGEVKHPVITDWNDLSGVHVPVEWLTIDRDAVNRDCAASDQFILAACCPRPFEQLQFLRGSEALYMDLADPEDAMLEFMQTMHQFYCQLLETWCQTDVDGINFMDDWGSQRSLLISPRTWCELFKPMYRDYIQIAHAAGKKAFMHSDGYTLEIYPHLIELGLDAFNSQIFCMGVDQLVPFAGKITFWGEIDRQGLLPHGTEEQVRQAVRDVYRLLWRNGGCIAELEFGGDARPENVEAAFDEWNRVHS